MNENNIPLSQELDAHKLESDGIRELFKIQLSDGVTTLYITAHNSVTWGDQTWDTRYKANRPWTAIASTWTVSAAILLTTQCATKQRCGLSMASPKLF